MKCFILLLFLTGCAPAGPNKIDPAFQSMFDQFVSSANNSNIDVSGNRGLTVQFYVLEQSTPLGEIVGECSSIGYQDGIISIDPNFWAQSDISTQTILLFHELGHCLLAEGHVNDPDAIMNPIVTNPSMYYTVSDWPGMLNQLFNEKGDYPTGVN